MGSGLREGWESISIEDSCEVEYGTRVVRKKDAGTIYPVYGGGGATFSMDISNREDCLVIARFAMSEKCTRFIKGKFFLNDSGLTVKTKDETKIKQSFLNLQFFGLNDYIYSLARGTAQKNLNVPAFRKVKLTYPKSIQEQKKIVAVLDEAFLALDKAKENTKLNLQNAKELFESYLQGVFDNSGEGWEEKTLKEVSAKIFAGGDAPKNNFSKTSTEIYNIPIYANAVKNNGLYGFTNKARVTEESITIAARGSGTGHTTIREEIFFPIVRLIVLIPNTNLINLNFFKYAIDTLDILKSGSAIPQLTVPMIKAYTIILPPLKEQQKIVKKLNAINQETKKLESIYTQKLTDLDELKKSILQKAFNGELS